MVNRTRRAKRRGTGRTRRLRGGAGGMTPAQMAALR